MQSVQTDIAIIGGGITGLWLLNRLRQAGFAAILLESATLGGEQTHKSQGILHGGMKYALQGALTASSLGVADAPAVWRACFEGSGALDLSTVPILSPNQYLWTTGSLLSRMSGFVASKVLQARARALTRDEFPEVFKHPDFQGNVYGFDEQVIDVHALIRELVKPLLEAIFHIDLLKPTDLHYQPSGELNFIQIQTTSMQPVTLKAKQYIFAAGSGNTLLLEKSGNHTIQMQRRPLHMVMAQHDFDADLYAHCLGTGSTPRITVTTHESANGKKIWYLGGQLAEEGTERSSDEQCAVARSELQSLFPWLDFSKVKFASFLIDRAEARQPKLNRPDSFSIESAANYFVAWPTKLVLAPLLAEALLEKLNQMPITKSPTDLGALHAWPKPGFAKPMWEQLF